MKRLWVFFLLVGMVPLFGQEVHLSLDEYINLWEKAHPPPPPPEKPPVSSVLDEVTYQCQFFPSHLACQGEGKGRVFQPGGVTLPLWGSAVVITSFLPPSQSSLSLEGDHYALILPQKGPFTFSFSWNLPLDEKKTSHSLVLTFPKATAQKMVVSFPPKWRATQASMPFYQEKEGRYVFAIKGGSQWWRIEKEEEIQRRPSLPLAFRVRAEITHSLSPETLEGNANLHVEIEQGEMKTFSWKIPEKSTMVNLSLPPSSYHEKEGEWEVLHFLEPRNTSFSLSFRLLSSYDPTGFHPFVLTFPREVKVVQEVAIRQPSSALLVRKAFGDFQEPSLKEKERNAPPEGTLADWLIFEGAQGNPPLYQVQWAEGAKQLALVVDLFYMNLYMGEGQGLAEVTLRYRNRGFSHMGITLPPGAKVWRVGGMEILPGEKEGEILLPLEVGKEAHTLILQYLQPLTQDVHTIPLPEVGAPVASAVVRLIFPYLLKTWEVKPPWKEGEEVSDTKISPLPRRRDTLSLLDFWEEGSLNPFPLLSLPQEEGDILTFSSTPMGDKLKPLVVTIQPEEEEKPWF